MRTLYHRFDLWWVKHSPNGGAMVGPIIISIDPNYAEHLRSHHGYKLERLTRHGRKITTKEQTYVPVSSNCR